MIALYIDLNPVRAGLVGDPKDYRFCGYGEAVAGRSLARAGLESIYGTALSWDEVQAAHRVGLFGKGSEVQSGARAIDVASFEKVLKRQGRLSLEVVLRCRVRYFTDAAVLGSQAFVQDHLARYQERYGVRKRTAPRALNPVTDWGGLTALRGLRRKTFG